MQRDVGIWLVCALVGAADLATHNKHVFVMDLSGQPLFWRHGSRAQASTKCPVLLGLVDRSRLAHDPVQ